MRVLNNVLHNTLAQVSARAHFTSSTWSSMWMRWSVRSLTLSIYCLVPLRVFLLSLLLLLPEPWAESLPPCGRYPGNIPPALRQLRSLGLRPKTPLSQRTRRGDNKSQTSWAPSVDSKNMTSVKTRRKKVFINAHAGQKWQQQVRQTGHCGRVRGVLRWAVHRHDEDGAPRREVLRGAAIQCTTVHDARTQRRHQPTQKRQSGRHQRSQLYMHSLVTRTFSCAQRAHFVLHTFHACHTHAWLKVMSKRCLSHVCLGSLSRFLPSHVSPILAVPARSLRDQSWQRLHCRSRPHVLAVLSRPESAGHAPLRTCIAKFGYLAKSAQRVRQKYFCGQWHDALNDPDRFASDFSKTTNENTSQFGVLTMFESSVLHVFHWWFCSSDRKQRKHAIGKPLLDREKQKKEKVWRSVMQSRCQRKVNGTVLVWVWRVTENSILMDEISENIFNEELDKLSKAENSIQKNYIWMSTTWRSRNQSEEIQNTHYSSHSASLFLKNNNYWKPIRASSTCSSTWENTFV